jgi:TonB family protein
VDYRLLGIPLVMGFSGWQLWLAFTRGEVSSQYGGPVRRADAPIRFWFTAGAHALLILLFAAVGAVLAWRAIHPPPLEERIAALYPRAAVEQKVEGHAILACTVRPSYGVKDCRVASETPPAVGFGRAAIEIAKLITLPERDRGSTRPGQTINLPIRFKLPAGDR